MPRIQLIHWKETEWDLRLERLEAAGFQAFAFDLRGGNFPKIKRDPPDAIVIDLGRLPSHGRAVAFALRHAKSTRAIPLIFADGPPPKVDRIRQEFPDASFVDWDSVPWAIRAALAQPVRQPIVPKSSSGLYAGKPLSQKLGLKPDQRVLLVRPPSGFPDNLQPLPPKIKFLTRPGRALADLVIVFAKTREELLDQLHRLQDKFPQQGIWIAWPKKKPRQTCELNPLEIRRAASRWGLADYKICAFDADWSGMKFGRKKRLAKTARRKK